MKEPLVEVIATHPGILVVLFTGPGGEAEEQARATAKALTEALPPEARARFLEAEFSCRRQTARELGIHGAPAIALFRNGDLVLRRLGSCTPQEVPQLVDRLT